MKLMDKAKQAALAAAVKTCLRGSQNEEALSALQARLLLMLMIMLVYGRGNKSLYLDFLLYM